MDTEPQLTNRIPQPGGVLRKNIQYVIYAVVVSSLLLAAVFGNRTKKPVANGASAPPPVTATNTANNAAAFNAVVTRNQEGDGQGKAPTQGPATGPQALDYSPNGLPLPNGPGASTPPPQVQTGTSAGAAAVSPAAQEAEQLAQKERERQYASRFESSIAYTAAATAKEQPEQSASAGQPGALSNLTSAQAAREGAPREQGSIKRGAEINVDSAVGQPYVVYEGTTLDTVLMNRLDGDAVGDVKVLVSQPLYSHDHQRVLIPDGTVILGESRKIGSSGFGQQRRIAVVFHRLIMPSGYTADLDQFHGLDQIGEVGLKDQVNNHYLQIFGTSIALGVISGAAQLTEGGTSINSSGTQAFTNGAAAGVSEQAATILDRFIQIPPTITIREGHRVKVYISQDMLLPAYANQTIPQTF